jgi:hypothetical protein
LAGLLEDAAADGGPFGVAGPGTEQERTAMIAAYREVRYKQWMARVEVGVSRDLEIAS